MAETIKICKHNTNGTGYCDILGGYCVDGPCSHEELAEYAPVRHGRWEDSTDEWFGTDVYTCSKCRESYVLLEGTPKENLWHYCPNCGAYMRGEEVGNANMESEE